MRYIVYLSLDGFYIQRSAQGRRGPLAVVRDGIILDVNPEAARRGISSGIEQRTARAIVTDAEFISWEEDLYKDDQRRWLDICTDFSGVIEPDQQHSAYIDLSNHPNPVDVSEKLVRTLVSKTGLRVRFGSARSMWIAKLAKQKGDCGVAIRNPQEFLSELAVSNLLPVSREHRERLAFLGYRTIGEILSIPYEILFQQFGPEGREILRAARGQLNQNVRPLYPPDSIVESLIFESAIESLETVNLALNELATRIGERLSSTSLQGQELSLEIEMESGEVQKDRRKFSKPIYNKIGALASLWLLMEELLQNARRSNPEGSFALCAIRLHLANLKPNQERQKKLLGHERSTDGSAFQHVRTVFGDTSVQLGSDMPVPRRVKVLREWKNAIGWS